MTYKYGAHRESFGGVVMTYKYVYDYKELIFDKFHDS